MRSQQHFFRRHQSKYGFPSLSHLSRCFSDTRNRFFLSEDMCPGKFSGIHSRNWTSHRPADCHSPLTLAYLSLLTTQFHRHQPFRVAWYTSMPPVRFSGAHTRSDTDQRRTHGLSFSTHPRISLANYNLASSSSIIPCCAEHKCAPWEILHCYLSSHFCFQTFHSRLLSR